MTVRHRNLPLRAVANGTLMARSVAFRALPHQSPWKRRGVSLHQNGGWTLWTIGRLRLCSHAAQPMHTPSRGCRSNRTMLGQSRTSDR
jgi:hypothetical protein